MTDAKLSALESAAKAATPGPWKCDSLSNVWDGATGIVYRAIDTTGHIPTDKDANFIAAANPAAVLELIAELRQARAERDWLADELAAHCNAQCAEVYDADGHFCNMCKSKCRFPFFECEDVTRQKWIEEAVGYASCCLRGK